MSIQEIENGPEPAAAWQMVQSYLTDLKMGIYAEINSYPPPVTGCDQQFNYLLERRVGVQKELMRLKKQRETYESSTESFINSSTFLDDEAKVQLLQKVIEE